MARFIFRHETHAKTLTYCLMHFVVAMSIAYLLSGDWAIALSIGIIEPLAQTFCYNFHERGWRRAHDRHHHQTADVALAR